MHFKEQRVSKADKHQFYTVGVWSPIHAQCATVYCDALRRCTNGNRVVATMLLPGMFELSIQFYLMEAARNVECIRDRLPNIFRILA